jgi:ribosomal protein S18 acetylase RimI-like enzyme
VKTVRLEVDVRNAPARRFYEGMGFEETRRLPDYYGTGLDGLRMVKEL